MSSATESALIDMPSNLAMNEKEVKGNSSENGNNTEASNEAKLKDEDEEVVYPGHLKFGLLFASLCVAVFQVVLDEVVVATALPTITDEFNSLADIGCV
ncbi:hypothetical protein ACMFMF_011176 [Clarireedia jacksonii]